VKPAFFIPRRTGANNRRGGAPRGERPADAKPAQTAQACLRRTQGARDSAFTRVFVALMRLRTYVTGPPTGAAAPERLSALRFPFLRKGKTANLGGHFASGE